MAELAEYDYKLKFAELLHRIPRDGRLKFAGMVAKEVFGKDTCDKYPMYVLNCAEHWPLDPIVSAEVDRLDLIPIPKELVLKDIYGLATDKFADHKDKVAAFRLYSDMNGWTVKATTKPNEGNSGTNDLLSELSEAVLNPADTSQT